MEKTKLGVIGMAPYSGCTFTASALAFFASASGRHAAFIQMEKSCEVYDALGMDRRFAGRSFTDFFKVLSEEKSIKGIKNIDSGINWALRMPHKDQELSRSGEEEELASMDYMRIANNIRGDFIICDFGSSFHDRALYQDMDYIVFVIDPMPSKLLMGEKILASVKSMELKGYPVIWVVNKDNPGINKKQLKAFLSLRKYKVLPLLDEALFYCAQYNCEIPALQKGIREKTEKIFLEMLNEVKY